MNQTMKTSAERKKSERKKSNGAGHNLKYIRATNTEEGREKRKRNPFPFFKPNTAT